MHLATPEALAMLSAQQQAGEQPQQLQHQHDADYDRERKEKRYRSLSVLP